ncbi:hypothetical protein QY97_00506 [Bacillus thermotolerans]|uniref:Uncharacterized protein n=1 Tax=Bacillus thermotolerans TaxID=1221996 RepID=A0A0F5I4G0_BACTR|nr:hypothetical protein QY97_00506 [Bacillus thermotolerans]KKB40160.1 hypothetical protein QY95_01793 [Bacillus thermotolerans]
MILLKKILRSMIEGLSKLLKNPPFGGFFQIIPFSALIIHRKRQLFM